MKIIKYKKMSKGKYKITFDTTELVLYEDVIIKNNLLLAKNISLNTLEKVMEENRYYEVYNQSLSLIEIKMRTEKELIENLEKKGFEKEYINKAIEKLKNEGYLNEKRYIEAYINDKVNLTSFGPYKIKRNLLDLELPENLINDYLETISYETWKEKLTNIINKRLKLMKNKSSNNIKNKLKVDLFNLGYQNELIDELLYNINKNDDDALKKEYEKAYNKYSKKYEGKSLKYQIKNYLYKKGFDLDLINSVLDDYE